MRASLLVGRSPSNKPHCGTANPHSFIVRARHRGRHLFGYFFFAVEEKVTRSLQASGSSGSEFT
jgi:hypothetical protein